MHIINKSDIKELIEQAEEPAVSIYMSTSTRTGNFTKKMSINFKDLLKEAGNQLEEKGYSGEKMLEEAKKLIGDLTFWQNQSKGLAVFITPEFFTYYKLPVDFNDRVEVGERFYIKDLLQEVNNDRKYYVLALSKNSNRFFECTHDSIDEIEVDVPEDINDTLKFDDPEKSIQYHTHTGEDSAAIFHGQGVTDEDNEEDLLRYLRQINKGLHEILENKKAPLIFYGVEELYPLYKRANTYHNLLDGFIKGNPDRVNEEEVKTKSWNIIQEYVRSQNRNIIDNYMNLIDTEKTSSNLKEIIPAAYYSKIDQLILQKDEALRGKFEPELNLVVDSEEVEDYDLLNFAVVHTIKNGGDVYLFNEEEMPEQMEAGAIYRYNA